MRIIEIYTKSWCPYCTLAKQLLDSRALDYHELDVTSDSAAEDEMIERSGRHTVPQAFVGDRHLGGYDDLARLDASGELEAIAQAARDVLVS